MSPSPSSLFPVPTLYPADHSPSSAAHIGNGVLSSSSYLAEGRPSGTGDTGQALLRLGGGALCGLLCGFGALGHRLGSARGGGSGAALYKDA